MSNSIDGGGGTTGGLGPRVARAARAIRVDLTWLHAAWMGVAFPPERRPDHSVVERWRPRTARGVAGYWLWAAAGVPLVAAVYPLFLVGLAARFYARRLDRVSASLGLAGVVLVSAVAWGLLTAATYLSPIAFEGLVAVAVAGVVATASAVLALLATRWGGRVATVALGYPLGVTALFLPPAVASLYSPTLASVVFPGSESVAAWLLDNVLDVAGLAAFVRANFELAGLAYVGMWFGLAVPTGWALGGLVTLAAAVRPSRTMEPADIDNAAR